MKAIVRDIPPRAAALVLALVLLAGIVIGGEQPPVSVPPVAAVAANGQELPPQELPLDKLVRHRPDRPVQDLFASIVITPPAPPAPPVAVIEPPAPAAQPRAPAAPPLPFTYLGRMVKNERTLVYLLKGEEMVVAQAGQSLGDYRIEGIDDAAVTFLYLPSDTRQSLSLPKKD